MHQEMLAVPQGLGDPRTFEALSQLAGRDACEDPRIGNDDAADALAEAGRIQMPLDNSTSGNSGIVSSGDVLALGSSATAMLL
jgi:hypothetical protein